MDIYIAVISDPMVSRVHKRIITSKAKLNNIQNINRICS